MTKVQVEKFSDCMNELWPIFQVHHKELGLFQDRMPLEPQWHEYIRQEVHGSLFLVTARNEGKIVGYIILQINRGLHYSSTVTALTDIVYVVPEYRNKGIALLLFKRAQRELKKRGVQYWISGYKEHNPLGMPEFLRAFKFTPADVHYSKWIG